MVAYNKFNQFVDDQASKVHDLTADALTFAFCAAANAPVATNSVLGDLTQIAYTYLQGNPGSRLATISSAGQTGGLFKLVLADLVLTADGGSVGPLRYPVLFNDTPSSPLDPLISWWDIGQDVTLDTGDTLTLDLDGTNGVLTFQ